jgi:Patatin-like phospholipase
MSAPPSLDPPYTPDQKAAHEFLSELRTRITTQPLPYQHGVEDRALESLWEIFGRAREAMNKNTGCEQFAAAVTQVLNMDVRPVTAKWHRAKAEGRLQSRDGADEFRADLAALQAKLRKFAVELHTMAYGRPAEDEITPPALTPAELARCAQPVRYRVHRGEILSEEQAVLIENQERREIALRRGAQLAPGELPEAPDNLVGLALSGGGIRSATFSLGVSQVLADRGLLADVDILSTVSGGGYTGAFLAGTLSRKEEGQPEVAKPAGPDTEAVRRLRLHAKFLASANLKESWTRVTAAFAGLLLNWTAPLFLVVATALLAKLGACWGGSSQDTLDLVATRLACEPSALGGDVREDVLLVFKVLVVITGLSLLAYAVAMRKSERASQRVGTLLGSCCAATAAVGIAWLLATLYVWLAESWSAQAFAVSVPLATAVSAVGTMAMRFTPIAKNPKVRALVLRVLLYAAAVLIPLLGLIAIYVCFWVAGLPQVPGWPYGGFSLLVLVAVLAAGVSFLFLNINATSPHRLYRDGIARTFVGQDVRPLYQPLKDSNQEHRGPYHLINTTLNLPASENPALRDRRADFFLMSKRICGSPATRYAITDEWKVGGRDLDIATAVAISGAAVSPHMGLGAMPSLTALLAFLNVRLGFWLLHPQKKKSSALRAPGFVCLLREMTGLGMTEESAWLNVSDGGHIENLAVYELLRRRCKFIVSVDGEADSDFTYHGLMTLVRHAQIDLGVRIDARLNELRPDPATGYTKRHAMLWRVYYPDGDIGLMLYVKLSVTGNESELIRRYRTTHPEFPHQSTLDQFFDEEQFEAYRELGVHVAEGLFTLAVTQNQPKPESVSAWFKSLAANLLEPEGASPRSA